MRLREGSLRALPRPAGRAALTTPIVGIVIPGCASSTADSKENRQTPRPLNARPQNGWGALIARGGTEGAYLSVAFGGNLKSLLHKPKVCLKGRYMLGQNKMLTTT